MYLIHKAKKVKKVENCKINKVQTKRFRLFAIIILSYPDDGKQQKTFGLNFYNFTIFNFFNFFSLVYETHFIEQTLWTFTILFSISYSFFASPKEAWLVT